MGEGYHGAWLLQPPYRRVLHLHVRPIRPQPPPSGSMRGTPSRASSSLGAYSPNIRGIRAQPRIQRRRKVCKRRKRVHVCVVSCGQLFDCTYPCMREAGRGRQSWSPRCAAHSKTLHVTAPILILLQPCRHESLRSPAHFPTHHTPHTSTLYTATQPRPHAVLRDHRLDDFPPEERIHHG